MHLRGYIKIQTDFQSCGFRIEQKAEFDDLPAATKRTWTNPLFGDRVNSEMKLMQVWICKSTKAHNYPSFAFVFNIQAPNEASMRLNIRYYNAINI